MAIGLNRIDLERNRLEAPIMQRQHLEVALGTA